MRSQNWDIYHVNTRIKIVYLDRVPETPQHFGSLIFLEIRPSPLLTSGPLLQIAVQKLTY